MKNRRFDKGFTLIELMVTVAVAATVLAVGVPSFRALIQNNRLTAALNDMVTEFNLARSEAVKRGSPVTLCKRNTAGTDCDNSAVWLSGWIVFADADGDGTVDSGDQVLRVRAPLSGLTRLNFGSRNRVTFDGHGFATGYSGTMSFCDDRGATKAKGLVLSNTGRLRSAGSGDTLSCS
jgi:type IV fimbrial biogenesis protein FimT